MCGPLKVMLCGQHCMGGALLVQQPRHDRLQLTITGSSNNQPADTYNSKAERCWWQPHVFLHNMGRVGLFTHSVDVIGSGLSDCQSRSHSVCCLSPGGLGGPCYGPSFASGQLGHYVDTVDSVDAITAAQHTCICK